MRRQSQKTMRGFSSAVAMLAIALIVAADALPQFNPNDPGFDPVVAEQSRYAEGLYIVNQKGSSNWPFIIGVKIDTGVDPVHPDFVDARLVDDDRDFTSSGSSAAGADFNAEAADGTVPVSLCMNTGIFDLQAEAVGDSNGHGTQGSSIWGARANNGQGIAGGNLGPTTRIKVVSYKVIAGAGTAQDPLRSKGDWARNAFDALPGLQEKYGVPVIGICSFQIPEDNSQATQVSLANLKANKINLVVAAGTSASPFNLDGSSILPTSYGGNPSYLVTAVAALGQDGNSLDSFALYGPHTVGLAATGVNVKVLFPTNIAGGAFGSQSGSSPATDVATLALMWEMLYGAEKDPIRARDQVLSAAKQRQQLPGLLMDSGGILDTAGALGPSLLPAGGTMVGSVTYDGAKTVVISGSGFGSTPTVLINGQDVTSFTRSVNPAGTTIKLKAKAKFLGLKFGQTNTVVVIGLDGTASNSYGLTL